MLLVAEVVSSRGRLSKLAATIVAATLVVTILAVLTYRGVIHHPAFVPIGAGSPEEEDPQSFRVRA